MCHTMMHLDSPRVILLVQLKVNTGAVYSLTALFGKTLEKLGFNVTFLQIRFVIARQHGLPALFYAQPALPDGITA